MSFRGGAGLTVVETEFGDVVTAAQRGDHAAFGTLVQAHRREPQRAQVTMRENLPARRTEWAGLVAEVTTFSPKHFPAFGLPPTV